MLDLATVVDLCRKRDKPVDEVLAAAGENPGAVRRTLRENPDKLHHGTVLAICKELGISVADIDHRVVGPQARHFPWLRFGLKDIHLIAHYHHEVENSRHVVTITRGIESYLQTPEMTQWTSSIWLGNPGWDQRIDLTKTYRVQIVGARERSKFIHRIVAPGKLFVNAVGVQPGWVEDVKSALKYYEMSSLLGLVWRWREFSRAIKRIIPAWVRRWEKISIVDGMFVLVRGSVEQYAMTYDRSTVTQLLNLVERAVGSYVPAFAPTEKITQRRNKRVIAQAYQSGIMQLEDILRGKIFAQDEG